MRVDMEIKGLRIVSRIVHHPRIMYIKKKKNDHRESWIIFTDSYKVRFVKFCHSEDGEYE